MRIFIWGVFLIAFGIAIFAIQNSTAPAVTIKFLLWKFETSLIYTILGSIFLGILITLLVWAHRSLRASIRRKDLDQERPPT
jgi:uncharacterized integral membrane protein